LESLSAPVKKARCGSAVVGGDDKHENSIELIWCNPLIYIGTAFNRSSRCNGRLVSPNYEESVHLNCSSFLTHANPDIISINLRWIENFG
jgi:hypothetical protein